MNVSASGGGGCDGAVRERERERGVYFEAVECWWFIGPSGAVVCGYLVYARKNNQYQARKSGFEDWADGPS